MARLLEYTPEVITKLKEYFDRPYEQIDVVEMTEKPDGTETKQKVRGCKFPTIEGFCVSIGIHKQTLHNWMKDNKELFDVYSQCKQRQMDILITNTLNGNYKENFAKFVAMNLYGMKEKTENDHKSSDGSMTPKFEFKEK